MSCFVVGYAIAEFCRLLRAPTSGSHHPAAGPKAQWANSQSTVGEVLRRMRCSRDCGGRVEAALACLKGSCYHLVRPCSANSRSRLLTDDRYSRSRRIPPPASQGSMRSGWSPDRRRTGRRDQRLAGCALSQVRNCWNSACFAASVRLALTPGLVCARN